jgi:hypothetical protein
MKEIICLILAILAWLLLSLPTEALQPFPDTGQNKCYTYTTEVDCDSIKPGDPFYGQDGRYQPRIPRSYTKLGSGGEELQDSAAPFYQGGDWIMTRDNVTGLIWEIKDPDLWAINYSYKKYTWENASQLIVALNNAEFGGFFDWRLPNAKELSSLVSVPFTLDYYSFYFPESVMPSYYWTSSPYIVSDYAWRVYYDVTYSSTNYGSMSGSYCARAVRSESPPCPVFSTTLMVQ